MGSGLTNEQKNLILGTLLGDGSIEKRWKNPRLRIDHSVAQKKYVFWKYDILKSIATQEPHIINEIDKRSGKLSTRWYFSTKAIPELDFFYQLFYQNKRKAIKLGLLDHIIHPLSLAVWLMDDGSAEYAGASLQTHGFSLADVIRLMKAIQGNFGIKVQKRRNKGKWIIYFPKSSMEKLKLTVQKYVLPEFRYKLLPYSLR